MLLIHVESGWVEEKERYKGVSSRVSLVGRLKALVL